MSGKSSMPSIVWLKLGASMAVITMGYLIADQALYLAFYVSVFSALPYALVAAVYGVAGCRLPWMVRVDEGAR